MNVMENSFVTFLIETGRIQKTDLEKSLTSKGPSEDLSIEDQLLSSGLFTEAEFRSYLEEFYGVPFAAKEDFPQEPLLVNNLSDSIHEGVQIHSCSPRR